MPIDLPRTRVRGPIVVRKTITTPEILPAEWKELAHGIAKQYMLDAEAHLTANALLLILRTSRTDGDVHANADQAAAELERALRQPSRMPVPTMFTNNGVVGAMGTNAQVSGSEFRQETIRVEPKRTPAAPVARRVEAPLDVGIVAVSAGQCDERRSGCDDSGPVFQVEVYRTGARRYVCQTCYAELLNEGVWRRVD